MSASTDVDVRLIPFRQTLTDPFIELLQTLNLKPSLAWAKQRQRMPQRSRKSNA